MNPNSAPAWGSQPNYEANLTQGVSQLAPLAPTWNGAQNGVDVAQNITKPSSSSQGVLPAFWGKVESIASEGGNIAGGALSWAKTQLTDAVQAPFKYGASLTHAVTDTLTANSLSAQVQELSQRQDNIMTSYKSGQLSKGDYLKALNQLSQDNMNVQKQLSSFESKTSLDQQNLVKSTIGTVSDVVTIMTAGLATPEIAAANREATAFLTSASDLSQGAASIEKLASSSADWAKVSPIAQQALRTATTEVMQAAGKQATAGQLSRAVATDLLLKYPLTYNALSSTGTQVYNELNNNKYGDAMKTIAFNAALLFSGGPIGWGLKTLGKVSKSASIASGLQPGSILDELSSRIGNGDKRALAKIAQDALSNGNEADVKAMIVGLESNLKAANGNAAFAVNKITDHLENYIGWGSMKNMTHQQAWDNIVNYWKHASGLQDLKAAGKIEGMASSDSRIVVPGRFSTQDKNAIAEAVTKGDLALAHLSGDTKTAASLVSPSSVKSYMNTFGVDKETAIKDLSANSTQHVDIQPTSPTVKDRLQMWENYKTANPNAAFANNPNVDRQITQLIRTVKDPQQLHKAINKIPTQLGLEGIPKDYAKQMAKDGYIAIVPTSHNLPIVPFEQTTGKLATAGAEGNFFVKSASPIPVLQSVGNFLVKAGLSPTVATARVQDVFMSKFSAAASEFGFLHFVGDSNEQVAKDTLAKLSNYMKAPTGGMGIAGHYLPITDYRQLSTNDIVRALNVSKSDAKIVGDAIMQAYLDVPREITGLGNKILDVNFKINPAAKVFSRAQGAFRFSWNPVFTQARLPLKAEFLSQLQTGGKFPTVAGTNRFMQLFFPGQYKELNSIVDNPDFKALLGGGLGGEADSAVTGVSNVAKSELPPRTTLLPVAGVIKDMANKMGMDSAEFIKQFPTETQDAANAILHYDRNNNFLNSPLAKTLNFAFFPFRFNVKVTTFMAKYLAKQEPIIQYAAIKGMMNAGSYLQSPQGQAWYSQHSDAIALFKYFSPLETISTISSALQLKHDSIAQYGELGGLPFGWIPQATDAAGLTHFGQAYVNPKTGVIAKDYVPTSMYGAANAAIQDLLGSLFTYPGATAGLPSKGSVERRIVGGVLPGSSGDFKAVNPTNVNPQDQQFSQNIQQLNGTKTLPPTPQTSWGTQVPTTPTTITTPLPKTTSAPKKKKADFTPELLPGQTKLGQL